MGILDWIFGSNKRTVPVSPTSHQSRRSPGFERGGVNPSGMVATLDGPGLFGIEVVGESHYQAALERVCGGRCETGYEKRVKARLVLEDSNPYDSNAVRVDVEGLTVGYLSRSNAPQYRRAIREAGYPRIDAVCDAVIRGGWDRGDGDTGSFGVHLDLPLGEERPVQAPDFCLRGPASAIDMQGPGTFRVQAVGEQQFQHELRRLFKRRIPDGERIEVVAALMPEGDEHRPGSVRIEIGQVQVGYLSARSSEHVRKLLADAGRPAGPAICRAVVMGGWGEGTTGSFSVSLDLPVGKRM